GYDIHQIQFLYVLFGRAVYDDSCQVAPLVLCHDLTKDPNGALKSGMYWLLRTWNRFGGQDSQTAWNVAADVQVKTRHESRLGFDDLVVASTNLADINVLAFKALVSQENLYHRPIGGEPTIITNPPPIMLGSDSN